MIVATDATSGRDRFESTSATRKNTIAPHSTGFGISSQYMAMPVAMPSPALISVTVPK